MSYFLLVYTAQINYMLSWLNVNKRTGKKIGHKVQLFFSFQGVNYSCTVDLPPLLSRFTISAYALVTNDPISRLRGVSSSAPLCPA